MNKTQAVKTLNYYGKERNSVPSGMDWQPSIQTYREINEAIAVLDGDDPKALTKAGRELVEQQLAAA